MNTSPVPFAVPTFRAMPPVAQPRRIVATTAQAVPTFGLFGWGAKRYHLEFLDRSQVKKARKMFPRAKCKNPLFGKAYILLTRDQYKEAHAAGIRLANNVFKSGDFLH